MVRIQDIHGKIFYFVVCLRNIEGNETNIKRKRSEKALNFQAYFPTFPKGWLRSVTGSAKPWLPEGHLARKVGVTTHVACRSPRASWWFMGVHCFRRA